MKTNTAIIEIPKRRPKYGEGGIRKLAEDRWMISYYDSEGRRRRKSFATQAKAETALTTAGAMSCGSAMVLRAG